MTELSRLPPLRPEEVQPADYVPVLRREGRQTVAYALPVPLLHPPSSLVAPMPAAADVLRGRALMFTDEGVVHAEPGLLACVLAGVALEDALLGGMLQVCQSGLVEDASWSWRPGETVYAAPSGRLTQDAPAGRRLHQVGVAAGSASIFVRILPGVEDVPTPGAPQTGVSGGVAFFFHDQPSPAAVWVITHRMGRYPSVVVTDSAGSLVHGGVQHDSRDQLTLTFSAPFGGSASLN